MADIKIIVDSSDVVKADNRIDQLGNSGKVAGKGLDKASRGMNQFGKVSAMGGKKMNTFNMQIQQGGYQLQDFVVQLQSGTSFFTAFGQQGSQFAGVFGPQGAVIGAVIAIGAAVGGMAYNMIAGSSASRTLESALKDLDAALSKIDETTKLVNADFKELSDRFGAAGPSVRSLARAMQQLGFREAMDAAKGLKEELLSMYNGSAWGNVSRAEDMYNALRIGGDSAIRFRNALHKLKTAEGLTQQVEAATAMREQFELLVGSAGQMTEAQLEYFTALVDTEVALLELQGKLETSQKSQLANYQDIIGSAWGLAQAEAARLAIAAELDKDALKLRMAAGLAYFKAEQELQMSMHKAWVKNNKEENKLRLAAIEDAKKARRNAGSEYFRSEQQDQADAHQMRIELLEDELKTKNKNTEEEIALRRAVGLSYAREQQDLESQMHQQRVDHIKDEHKALQDQIALRRTAGLAYASQEDAIQAEIVQSQVDRIHAEHEARVKADKDAVDLRRANGMNYAKNEQQLEDDIHQQRIDNILNEAALREATVRAARASFNAGSGSFGEASQDVAAQRLAELRKAYQDSLKGDKSKASKKTDLEKLREQVNLETQLLGKSEARQKVMQAMGVTMGENFPKTEAGLERQIEKNLELIEIEGKRQALIDSITGSVENGMMAMIDGTMSVKDAFKSMASEIIKELYRVLVVQEMVASAKLAMDAKGGFMSMVSGFFGGGSANGNVFSEGAQVQAYANGGVVNGPTNFPMNGNKVGLMGEAGPEAIMPLKRGANGKLGVQAEGGGGDVINISQSFNFQANGDDSVKKLIAQAAPRIAELAKASVIESRRRGGSTKAAFN